MVVFILLTALLAERPLPHRLVVTLRLARKVGQGKPGVAPPTYRPEPVALFAAPGGDPVCRPLLAAEVVVLGRRKAGFVLVRPPRVQGLALWVREAALGLRVIETTDLLGSPRSTDRIGRIRAGSLVRVIRRSGRFALVNVQASANAEAWLVTSALSTKGVERYARMFPYVGGYRGAVAPGPLHATPGGRIVAHIRWTAAGRRLSTSRRGAKRWVRVALGEVHSIKLQGWVPASRFFPGVSSHWQTSTYARMNPARRSGGRRSRGQTVTLLELPVFASIDDAFPLWTMPRGVAARLLPAGRGWRSWRKLDVALEGLRCSCYVPWQPGLGATVP